ncbi:DUF3408 domain-containing protein [Petrimonas sp.]|uniref:DUF3408 domain-containing protein n=1 Tax=Petrimonas sp. TaxID=2023866 RepID=UPI003F512EF6
MATNKREVSDINEILLLSSIREKTPETSDAGKPKTAPETGKRTRTPSVDYTSAFLQKNELKSRQSVYISRDVYKTVSEIVRVIAGNDVSVGGYIDSVLMQHLETHKDEINALYKKERKDLIG